MLTTHKKTDRITIFHKSTYHKPQPTQPSTSPNFVSISHHHRASLGELIYVPESTHRDRPLNPEARPKGATVSFQMILTSLHTDLFTNTTDTHTHTHNTSYTSSPFISCTSPSLSITPTISHAAFCSLVVSFKISSSQNISYVVSSLSKS